jgi:hypothetical protein
MEAPQNHVDTQVNEVCRAYTCEGRHVYSIMAQRGTHQCSCAGSGSSKTDSKNLLNGNAHCDVNYYNQNLL